MPSPRLEMRIPQRLLDEVEDWRLHQSGGLIPPSRTAAVLHLINLGLKVAKEGHREYPPSPRSRAKTKP